MERGIYFDQILGCCYCHRAQQCPPTRRSVGIYVVKEFMGDCEDSSTMMQCSKGKIANANVNPAARIDEIKAIIF